MECDASTPVGARYCSKCGANFPDQTDPYERRIVTVLFADIAGYTTISEKIDPENLLEIMSDAYPCLLEPVQEYDGSIIQVLGDAVLAYFGVPLSKEDDPERAILAGLKIVERIQLYAKKLQDEQILASFHVRVGINTGLVVVGELIQDKHLEYLALGDAVNLADRLQQYAPLDSVLINHTTYQHVQGLFDVRQQSPLIVKGRSQVEQTYLVEGQKPLHLRLRKRGLDGVTTTMIGREPEMAALKNYYRDSIYGGESALILISGDAGIGKTRLLNEFTDWITLQSISPMIFRGRAISSTQSKPYGVLRNLFARSFGILESDSSAQALEKFRKGTSPFIETEQADLIGQLVGFDFKFSPNVSHLLGNASFNDIALLYLKNYIRTLAKNSLLLLLEDLHWMDDRTLDLITDLASESRVEGKTQMMILCTTRSEFFEWHSKWGEVITGFNTLKLRKLSQLQCRLLIDEILFRVEDIPDTFYKRILDEAGGNPFFIEELIKMLIEEDVIEAKDGSWWIRLEKLADVQVPSTISGILQARLDSLPLPERKVLQRAAIIGRTFWDGLLLAFTENEEEAQKINARLTSLRERGLIFPNEHSSIAGSQEYLFKHALLCNEAYETVLLKHRRTYHRQVAAWIEENAGDRLEEHLALIANHYLEGDRPEPAADWFIRAGERANNQCTMQEAKTFFEQALNLLDEEDWIRIWRATLGHDEAVGTLGELDIRHADDMTLLYLAEQRKDDNWLAEAYFRIGSQAKSEGGNREALRAFNQALEAAKRTGDLSLQALILPMIVTIHTAEGNLQAADKIVDRSLELAHDTGDADILARALTNLAPYYQAIGDLTQSVKLMHQQVEITQQQGNRLGEAFGLINLGYFYLSLGHFETGHSLLERALKISRLIGARSCIAYSLLNLGLAEWRLGQTESACQTLQLSLEKLESLGDHGGLASRQFYLGLTYESANDISEATRHFTAALDGFKLLNATSQIVEVQAALARLTLETGDEVQAEEYALQIIHYLDQEGAQGLELPTLVYLSCAVIFKALKDTRLLNRTLQNGRKEIQDRISKISDERWRKIFLKAIPENYALMNDFV